MASRNKETGKRGEEIAGNYLRRKGMSIIARNYRFRRYGEIDIIAKDGSVLVFVEVKTRRTFAYGRPFEAVDLRKQANIRLIAESFRQTNRDARKLDCRFDVVSISMLPNGEALVRHIENAF